MDNSTHTPVASDASSPPPPSKRSKLRKVLRILLIVLVISPLLLLIGLWSALAIYFSRLPTQGVRTTLS